MADDERVEREWIYIGMRLSHDGKERHAWLDHNDEERIYDGIKGHFVGGVHKVVTTPDGDSVYYAKRKKQEYLRPSDATEEKRIEWRALHNAAEGAKRLMKEAEKIDELFDALEPLQSAYMKCRTKHERAALIGHVIQRVTMGRV